jgi:membrane-associated phospholipid phosphatase
MVLGCAWSSAGLVVTGPSSGAARPQEPGSQSSEAAPVKAQETDKTKPAPDESTSDPNAAAAPSHHGLTGFGKDFLEDQKQIWTSPARLRFPDADWLVPASGFAAGLFVTDRDFSTHLSNNPSTISHYKTLSTAGVGALVGGAAALWALSYPAHNEHWRETGFLAGEAAINSLVAVEAMKYTLRRERPFQGDGSGPFFQSGTSFPSEHAAAAWSVAGVIAHEYPGPLPKIVAYGLASLVSFSRVRGKQHFNSDVFIGGMIGQLVAQDVYSRRHDPELGGAEWRSIGEIVRGDGNLSAANQGSPYVELDSWIYPALDRLIATGFVQTATLSMRPWTRLECVRLLNEAEDSVVDIGNSPETEQLIDTLREEFSADLKQLDTGNPGSLQIESVYTRFTGISGTPLVLGTHYDFGQTLINDFGRPYEEGFNNVAGFSGWASEGRLVAYVRGEYQFAPAGPALPGAARLAIKEIDSLPEIVPPNTSPSTSRVRLLDAYVALNLDNWQFSFGKQSLWWGPGLGGPMLFSDNVEPINMFRINRVSPLKLPGILGRLGPLRLEFFVGQLEGHQIAFGSAGFLGQVGVPLQKQPFLHGQKFSLKPTKNFEFSFSRTTIFAGAAVPFTPHELWFSLTSTANGFPGGAADPGDRRSAFDFTYRVPKLRNWLTFYVDGFTDDQFSPVAYWDRSAWSAGIYLARLPKLHKLDFRAEGIYTDLPIGGEVAHGFFYFNLAYRNGYTNYGNLIGSWIGRQGQGAQAWTTYSLSSKSSIQVTYRHEKVSNQLVPNGGTITDASVRPNLWLRPDLSISGLVQYEVWNFPVLAASQQTNVTGSLGVTFWPHRWNK